MTKLDVLRRQHDAALNMAQRLLELIDGFRPGSPGYPILMQLNRLYGVLRLHFVQEDIQLYSRLMSSPNREVAQVAQRFVEEMGGLALDLECFARHWSCSASIVNNFDEFREAANELMLRLAVRVERENKFLFPLAEAEDRPRRNAA